MSSNCRIASVYGPVALTTHFARMENSLSEIHTEFGIKYNCFFTYFDNDLNI